MIGGGARTGQTSCMAVLALLTWTVIVEPGVTYTEIGSAWCYSIFSGVAIGTLSCIIACFARIRTSKAGLCRSIVIIFFLAKTIGRTNTKRPTSGARSSLRVACYTFIRASGTLLGISRVIIITSHAVTISTWNSSLKRWRAWLTGILRTSIAGGARVVTTSTSSHTVVIIFFYTWARRKV